MISAFSMKMNKKILRTEESLQRGLRICRPDFETSSMKKLLLFLYIRVSRLTLIEIVYDRFRCIKSL